MSGKSIGSEIDNFDLPEGVNLSGDDMACILAISLDYWEKDDEITPRLLHKLNTCGATIARSHVVEVARSIDRALGIRQ